MCICFFDYAQMEEIVSKFGIVVCTRNGSNVEKFIYESDLLTQHKVRKCADLSIDFYS